MIRTLIFGAIAGYVGKKLYDDGKLDQFRDDLVSRYNNAKAELADQRVVDNNTTDKIIKSASKLAS